MRKIKAVKKTKPVGRKGTTRIRAVRKTAPRKSLGTRYAKK